MCEFSIPCSFAHIEWFIKETNIESIIRISSGLARIKKHIIIEYEFTFEVHVTSPWVVIFLFINNSERTIHLSEGVNLNLIDCQGYFIPVVLGVIFGEMLFQSASHMAYKWRFMAKGYLVCLEHTVLYTAAMLLFLYLFAGVAPLNMTLILSISIGHYILEKLPTAFWWMKYVKCEHNPLFAYFEAKLGPDSVNTQEWYDYIGSYPALELNEQEMNSFIFYISEFAMVSRLTQFALTFTTIIVLDLLKYI
jgi:hypothetical protein